MIPMHDSQGQHHSSTTNLNTISSMAELITLSILLRRSRDSQKSKATEQMNAINSEGLHYTEGFSGENRLFLTLFALQMILLRDDLTDDLICWLC